METLVEGDNCHTTQHNKFALGKIYDTGGIVDEAKTKSYESINAAAGNS